MQSIGIAALNTLRALTPLVESPRIRWGSTAASNHDTEHAQGSLKNSSPSVALQMQRTGAIAAEDRQVVHRSSTPSLSIVVEGNRRRPRRECSTNRRQPYQQQHLPACQRTSRMEPCK